MTSLYPKIKPYATHEVTVDDPHVLYVEECGDCDGIPVLFLHGGPGTGIEPYHRQYFNPDKYRIILFDQRGSGKSTPHACIEKNTTRDLIRDIEFLRKKLSIEQWIVFGGSWGSTLALAYAQAFPDNVSALVLRGIFLCRQKELDWIYKSGASKIFPDYWQDFLSPISEDARNNLLTAYSKILNGKNEIAKMAASKAWSIWEGRTASLTEKKEVISHFSSSKIATAVAMIECHYFINHGFLEENQLISNVDKIRHIPGYIVQGRYDMICPVESAWELHRAWPEAHFSIVKDAGHAGSENSIASMLVSIMNELARQIAKQ